MKLRPEISPVRFLTFISALLIISVSCGRRHEHQASEFIEFGKGGMNPGLDYIFSPIEMDSSLCQISPLDAVLIIRYSEKCNVDTLPLIIESSSLSADSISHIKINLPLFDNQGQHIGKGSFGIFENRISLPPVEVDEGSFVAIRTEEHDTEGIISAGLLLFKN